MLSKGARIFERHVTFAYVSHPSATAPSMSCLMIASKRNFPKAVHRNFAKRRMKAALRIACRDLNIKTDISVSVSISAKKTIIDAPFAILLQSFKVALQKLYTQHV